MTEVRQYYTDYVQYKGLKKYFRNFSTVTSVDRLPPSRPRASSGVRHVERVDSESGEQDAGCICGKNTSFERYVT